MSYYEDRIKALEARIEEMSRLNRMKAITVEAQIMDRIAELIKDNARLKAELARLRASSFVTAVPVEEYEKLKAEVERLENLVRYWSEKYQNENARFLRASERIAAKEGKPSV